MAGDRKGAKAGLNNKRPREQDLTSHILRTSMLWLPDRVAQSAWLEHVPFAFWLVDVLRPKRIVELGTQFGVSYSAMCQAVKYLGLATSCFAIDTWKGDKQAGFYDEDVFSDFSNFNDRHYGGFSRLIRSTFDEARDHFGNESINLLHIDGLHTYEAVRHDYESWLPKLSTDSVVLFHDTNVREGDFGVFRFWRELTQDHPHFDFLHGHGLGVLGIGNNFPSELQFLFRANQEDHLCAAIRECFRSLGRSVHLLFDLSKLKETVTAHDRESVVRAGQIDGLRQQLSSYDKELSDLKNKITEEQRKGIAALEALTARAGEVAVLQGAATARDAQVANLNRTLLERDAAIAERDAKIASLDQALARAGDKIVVLDQALTARAREVAVLKGAATARDTQLANLNRTVLEHDAALAERDAKIASLDQAVARAGGRIVALDRALTARAGEVAVLQGVVTTRDAQVANLNRTLLERDAAIAERGAKVAALDQTLSERASELDGLKNALVEREIHISSLQSTISALHASTSWRATAPLRLVKRLLGRLQYSVVGYPLTLCLRIVQTRSFAPLHDWRAVRIIVRSELFDREWYLKKNPDVAAIGIDPIRHYVAFGAREGRDPGPSFSTRGYLANNPDVAVAGANPLVHFALHGAVEGRAGGTTAIDAFDVTRNKAIVPAPINLDKSLDDLKSRFRQSCLSDLQAFLSSNNRIGLPTSGRPDVSIIIVIFNNAELTFACLRALADGIDVPSEVIIVDNASTDLTLALCARVDGARVIRNNKNIHFVHAVNQAAPETRGNAVLLLNSDASIKRGSISAAYMRLQEEANVGAVGGKIVLLDGTLQEAGSIIWSDGSCVGYGRGRQPSDSEFQFRRDVDYCSGAFLLVGRSLFKRLNWFDTAFSPAYYEEADLCMRIREAGFRVVYEPKVEISHFEFGSSTNAEAAIVLQQRNRALFVERHCSTLKKNHHKLGTIALNARMNDRCVGRILVIDDQLPDPTLGSGFSRARSILCAIHEAGWFSTIYPRTFPNVVWDDAYQLLPPDVEIMGDQGSAGLEPFLKSRIGYYDAVLVSRPHNMAIFNRAMARNREFLKTTKLIYDAEAIFSMRDALHLKLAGMPLSQSEQQNRMVEEIALAERAAMVLAVSESEARIFRESLNVDVRVLGHSITDNPTSKPFNERSNILFVGALDDDASPNVDSLVWFVKDIMPLLDRLLGTNYYLNIVGRNASGIARKLVSPRVRFFGKVKNVNEFYSAARLFIAPTRYAAGLPMKVHEAAAVGLPVVATPLLADQLGWRHECELLVADDPKSFALACSRLYSDEHVWTTLRRNALERIKRECSPSEFSARIFSMLTAIKPSARFSRARSVELMDRRRDSHTTEAPIDGTAGGLTPTSETLESIHRKERVNKVWNADSETRAVRDGWYWIAHPMVARRINVLVSGHPDVDAYVLLKRQLQTKQWRFPVKHILSLGCGFGELERGLVSLNFAERYDAYDLSEAAIASAKRSAKAAGFGHIHYHVKDLENEELPFQEIDVVFAHQAIHHIRNLERLFEKVKRVLKPGGIFHLHEFVGPSQFQWTDTQLKYINEFIFSLPKRFRTLPSGEERPPIQRHTIEEMVAFDPTEAVRSSEIVSVLEQYFRVVERKNLGGALLHMGLANIAQNFQMDVVEDVRYLEQFFALEDNLMAEGVIDSDFVVLTAVRD